MSTLLNAWTVPRPVRKIGTSARLALSITTGMDGPPPPATDCEIDDTHQRVSAKTATPPTTSRAVIRTKRRASAHGHLSWLIFQWPGALRSQLCVYSTSTVSGKATILANKMEELVGSEDSLAYPRMTKIWPY